jgi:hypothetical protein
LKFFQATLSGGGNRPDQRKKITPSNPDIDFHKSRPPSLRRDKAEPEPRKRNLQFDDVLNAEQYL